jgi:hypothetical protein
MEEKINESQVMATDATLSEENIHKKISFAQKLENYFNPKGVEQEMLRYRTNDLARSLTLLALVLDIVGFSMIYSTITKVIWTTGIDIFVSVFMLLFSFITAEELKDYSKGWSYVSFALAVASVLRIVWYPVSLHNPNDQGVKVLSDTIFSLVVIFYIISAVLYVIAGMLTLIRAKALSNYLKTHKPMQNEIIGGKK